jgi:hypothetical protein
MSITISITVTDEQLACLSHDMVGFPNDVEVMTAELQRRVDWVIQHKVEQCARRCVEQQCHVLGDSRPTDTMEAAVLITAHPDFKNRDMCEAEAEAHGH